MAIQLGDGQRCFKPNDKVSNVRRCGVRPVIAEDLVIGRVGEGDSFLGLKAAGLSAVGSRSLRVSFRARGRPVQTLLTDEVGNAAVGSFDLARPREVAAELGGVSFECREVVCSCRRDKRLSESFVCFLTALSHGRGGCRQSGG